MSPLEPWRSNSTSTTRTAVSHQARSVRSNGPCGARHYPCFVPNGSVASTTGRTFVIRIRNGRTEWVDVKAGLTSGPLVEVFGDLKAGDDIVVRGTDELKAGASVQIKPTKPA